MRPRRFFHVFLALLSAAIAHAEEAVPAVAIRRLASDLGAEDRSTAEAAHREMERLAFSAGRPGAEAERKAFAQAFADEAARDDLSLEARARFLAALETIGKGEVVPTLGKLLSPGSPAPVREGARRALEANPHVNAKRALRDAVAGADDEFRVALMNSIGARRDFLATGILIEAAGSPNPAVKLAALDALSKIGDISAVSVIEASLKELAGPERAAAERAYIRLAESLVRSKERGSARRIYDRALGMGRAAKCAALVGLARAGLQNATPKIVAALEDPDPQVRGAALEAAAIMPGEDMTKALVIQLEEAEEAGKDRAALYEVLSRRPDPAAREPLFAAAEGSADPGARAAALRLLTRAARAGSFTGQGAQRALRAAVASLAGPAESRDAAEELLVALPAGDAGQALTGLLAEGGPPGRRAALLRVMGARGDRGALAAAHAAAKDPDPAVRAAAIDALGRLGDSSEVLVLIDVLRGEPGLRSAAERALGRLRGEGVDEQLVRAAKEETGSARASIVRALGIRGSPASLPVIEAAAKDADAEVRVAGLEALGRKASASGLPIVIEALDSVTEAEKAAAVSASLRIADAIAAERKDEAAKVYLKALAAGTREEDLREALEGLGETAGPEALDRLGAFIAEGPPRGSLSPDVMQGLRREAGRAALRVAEKLPEDEKERAKDIYLRILELRPDRATARQAARRLRRLGVDVDLGGRDGFVTRWWILGPIPNPEGPLWEKRLGPESGADPSKPLEIEGATHRWKSHDVPDGILSMNEAGYPAERAIAYLHADVVGAPGDALLKIGSDDFVACFLNGEKVHEHKRERGLTPDEDTVRVKLREGKNAILLKLQNQGGDWGACLRITDLDGKPLPARQGVPEGTGRQ